MPVVLKLHRAPIILPGAPTHQQATDSEERLRQRAQRMLVGFVMAEIALQLVTVFVDFAGARVIMRVAAFGTSLGFLAALPGPFRPHPSYRAMYAVLAILGIAALHPQGNT